MRRVLITGFEPFGGVPRNPSGDAALALSGRRLSFGPGSAPLAPSSRRDGALELELRGAVLPVSWARAVPALEAALEAHRPAAVLALGMAAATYRVERLADDVRRACADEDGLLPRSVALERRRTLPTALPVAEVEAALRALGCAVEPSDDAGGYLCNHVFLALLERAPAAGLAFAGFLHVPAPAHAPAAAVEAAVLAAVGAACQGRWSRFHAAPT